MSIELVIAALLAIVAVLFGFSGPANRQTVPERRDFDPSPAGADATGRKR